MSKEPRLHLRGNTYYFRAKIPAELRTHYGKREIKHSLKTKDYQLARRMVRQHSVRVDEEFNALRHSLGIKRPDCLPLDDQMIESICRSWEYNVLIGDDKTRIEGMSDDDLGQIESERQVIDHDLRQAIARGRTEVIHPILDTFMHLMKIELIGSTPDRERLATAFLKTVARVHGQQVLRDQGEVIETPPPAAHPGIKQDGQLMLEDLFDCWLRQYAGNNQKTIDSVASEVRQFQLAIGARPAAQYVRKDFLRYRDILQDEKGLEGKTAAKRIGFIRMIYQVAIDDELLKVNPAVRIKVKKSRKRSRLPFTLEELQRIFNCPLYSQGKRPEGGKGETSVWLPLIALYTGCREEEIGQLRTEDVRCDHGVWYFNLIEVEDEENNASTRLKTESSYRRMPLHPDLIEAGLLNYVEQMKKTRQTRLFPGLKPNRYGVLTANWGKWFNRYLDTKIGIDDPTRVFYSFRHNFSDACREAGLSEEIKDTLMGHAKNSKDSTGRSYGSGYSLKALADSVAKIRYPGLQIPKLLNDAVAKK
jgi:integrase